jgi:hypothetical protein
MHGYRATTNIGHTADDIDYSMGSKCKREKFVELRVPLLINSLSSKD